MTATASGRFPTNWRSLAKDLALVVTEIMGTSVEIAKLEQSVSALPVVEQKIKALSHGGSKAALAVNEAYKNKTAHENERLAIQQVLEILDAAAEKLSALTGIITAEGKPLLEKELAGPNGKLLKEALDALVECGQQLDRSLATGLQNVKQHRALLARIAQRLQAEHDRQELAFHKMIEEQDLAEKEAGERIGWEKKHTELVIQKRRSSKPSRTG